MDEQGAVQESIFHMQEEKKIISIKVPKELARKKQKYQITLEDGETLLVSEEELLRFSILSGKQYSGEEWEALLLQIQWQRAYQSGLDLVLFRKHTAREVYEKLKGKDYSGQAARQAVERLEEAGYIDDEHYAESYVRQHSTEPYTTLGQIRQTLRRKGISEDVLERVFAELDPEEEDLEVEKLKNFINNKYSKLIQAGEIDYNSKMKVQQALYRRGYPMDAIQRAVNEIWK